MQSAMLSSSGKQIARIWQMHASCCSTTIVPIMQLSHEVLASACSSWMAKRVDATLRVKHRQDSQTRQSAGHFDSPQRPLHGIWPMQQVFCERSPWRNCCSITRRIVPAHHYLCCVRGIEAQEAQGSSTCFLSANDAHGGQQREARQQPALFMGAFKRDVCQLLREEARTHTLRGVSDHRREVDVGCNKRYNERTCSSYRGLAPPSAGRCPPWLLCLTLNMTVCRATSKASWS